MMKNFEHSLQKRLNAMFDDEVSPFTVLLVINIVAALIYIASKLNTGVLG